MDGFRDGKDEFVFRVRAKDLQASVLVEDEEGGVLYVLELRPVCYGCIAEGGCVGAGGEVAEEVISK